MNPIKKAVHILGGQSALASAASAHGVTITQQNVWKWLQTGRVPGEYCPAIEAATCFAVTCEELYPQAQWKRARGGRPLGYFTPTQPTTRSRK